MLKFLTIAKWEYLERIKNRSFIFFTFIFPLIVLGIAFIPVLLQSEEDVTTKVVGIIEKNCSISKELENSLIQYKTKKGQQSYVIRKLNEEKDETNRIKEIASMMVLNKDIDGFLYIEKVSNDSFKVEYHTEKVTAITDLTRLEKALNQVLTKEKLVNSNLDAELINKLTRTIPVEIVKVSKSGREKVDTEKIFTGTFIFLFMLILSMLMPAGMLVRSVVEEKSNRVIEVLLSSCTAKDLMAGKILGLSALGLTQIIVWVLLILSIGGYQILQFVQIQDFIFAVIYFILGYILYGSLFIGFGSIANTDQDSQSIMSVLSIIVMLPVFLSTLIFEKPEMPLSKALSYFPLTAPQIMIIRTNITEVAFIEKILIVFLLIITIYFSILLSGKIFRVAILSYGKTPNLSEIIKWIKSK